MRLRKLFYTGLFFFSFQSAYALDLGIPVACQYGEDCFIENYFDHSVKVDEISDHTCGKLTQDGHVSTDFKLKNYTQMNNGVGVLAGDSGIVKYVRDGMSDISVDLIGEEAVRGRECGNGVVIEHPRGYETQYCHLKRGSIGVKQGEKVDKGQQIAQVGLSGIATFPYLEFTVKLKGKPLDPFTGDDPVTGETAVACNSLDIYPIWDKQTEKKLKYVSTVLLGAGFAQKVPHARGAREGKFSKRRIDYNTRLLVFWVDVFGVVKEDQFKITVIDPNGKVIADESRVFSQDRRHVFQFLGIKPEEKKWPVGEYSGRIEMLRKEVDGVNQIFNHVATVELYDPEEVQKESE